MAVRNLRCVRDGNQLAVTWSWDTYQEKACVTISRLLDGKELVCQNVGQAVYRNALNTPQHGPVFKVPRAPLHVTVEDADGAETVDVLDACYTVKWQVTRREIVQEGLFRKKVVGSETQIVVDLPFDSQPPEDLFCYVLTPPGRQPGKSDPMGFLPTLRAGRNVYGVTGLDGREFVLCCNPRYQGISRLFHLKKI